MRRRDQPDHGTAALTSSSTTTTTPAVPPASLSAPTTTTSTLAAATQSSIESTIASAFDDKGATGLRAAQASFLAARISRKPARVAVPDPRDETLVPRDFFGRPIVAVQVKAGAKGRAAAGGVGAGAGGGVGAGAGAQVGTGEGGLKAASDVSSAVASKPIFLFRFNEVSMWFLIPSVCLCSHHKLMCTFVFFSVQ